ncbi:aspartate carbamoyltransferase regulatory subunit [Candidatus Acetothermia bacterium]|nr:aspartate carbamoyltransferase regulatory subunit [Candidatus Acetothermia bacterium]MBI3643315.1 aspartate carbamoyltransferase regulatory subunit [Candidatus Acetothermia bacterium]
MSEDLKVSKIKRGTVIDHIPAGMAPTVLRILGISDGASNVVVVAMNVKSSKLGQKDIVKVENQILDEQKFQKISIIAPQAIINIIDNYQVVEKRGVSCPHELEGILKCPNRNCITADRLEKMLTYFVCEKEEPLILRCHYCETSVAADRAEIL